MSRRISTHAVRIYETVRTADRWLTARAIAVKADVADRTARLHVQRLTEAGVFQITQLHGGFRYRFNPMPLDRAFDAIATIEAVKRILV